MSVALARHDAPEPLGRDAVAAVVILLVSVSRVGQWASDSSLGLFLLRALWGLFYLAVATRLVRRFGTRWATWTIRHQPELCVLLAATFASCIWSLAPPITLQKAISLLGTTLLGVFIGYAFPPQRFMRVLHWTFTLLILSSIAVAALVPAPVAGGLKPGWLGITRHPNTLGAVAVFATIYFPVVTLTRRIHPLWGAALSALSLFALAQTHSRTSYAALGASLLASAYLAVAWVARRPIRATWRRVSFGLVLGMAVIPFLLAPLAAVLDDDPLNGRIRLWDGALTILRERPLTGYGYAVVWGRGDATLLPHIAITAHRSASNAHNGIVNVASELGLPAAIVACAYLFGALSNAARLFDRDRSPFSFFALAFLVGFAVMSFAEAHLLQIHWFFWIAFVALTVAVKRALDDPAARVGTEI